MITDNPNLLLAYYGDDFTGSTDALEFLTRAGIKTVLFIEPPTPAQLARYEGLQAIGVAGMTRSMSPVEMEKTLQPAFTALRALGVRHLHYKVCSTFDSSPVIGSIGKAIDIGAAVFKAAFVPVLVAAPALGRYCAFGNLFARMGIGSMGQIFRLDRHPSMSKHPVTPADESDLRLHLGKQTNKRIGLIDILQIAGDENVCTEKLANLVDSGAEIVLFDALYEDQLTTIGKLIDGYASNDHPLFSAGSSGIEMALGNYWTSGGLLHPQENWTDAGEASPLLVISGSCSPVTSAQISWALENGFSDIGIAADVVSGNDNSELIAGYINEAVTLLHEGTSVIIHSSKGNDDARMDETYRILSDKGLSKSEINTETSRIYGTVLGQIARAVAAEKLVKRILIAGGDTSSHAVRAMGIEAVEMIAPISPGAPLCKAFAPGSPVDGLEVNFKGGQVGVDGYFGLVRKG
ncbi:MAG: four-carbon acid sugar kinase family protein [Mucilaginibacter sp.]